MGTRLGLYAEADEDADRALNGLRRPSKVMAIMNKAEAQYNLGAFEHALKFFYRCVKKISRDAICVEISVFSPGPTGCGPTT